MACQRYFLKWHENPEFIFALVYKIIRDFVDSMDEILQPLVDKAMLVGCSCREEWISAMVTALSTYLSRELFPNYIHLLEGSSSTSTSMAKLSWLNLVDLMISFDKRIQALMSSSGMLLPETENENSLRISIFCVFCDQPDWLEIWAEIELGEMLEKLTVAMVDDKSWKTRLQGTVMISGSEDYKSPAVSGAILQGLSMLIDRSRPLPSIELRARFIRLAGAPIVRKFLDFLLLRCQEADGLTALADDDALITVSQAINAAQYFESTLTEWCESVFFLEMETLANEDVSGGCILAEEINGLRGFRTEWIEKISTVILRGFDALCRDYYKNKKIWLEKTEGIAVSRAFIGALDSLQGKFCKLEEVLNGMDFIPMWRSVAGGVDQQLFTRIFMSGAKFNSSGVERLSGDLEVLFGVFAAWCLRPQGFFPKISEGWKLLKMDDKQLKDALLKENERWLTDNSIRHLTVAEAERIAKSRISM